MQCKGCGASDFVALRHKTHIEYKCKYCGRKDQGVETLRLGKINISGGNLHVGGDLVGGDKIVLGSVIRHK